MSVGLMCDCPLPPMEGLTPSDRGHYARLAGKSGCPQYAADQDRGGRCEFCADAERLRTHVDLTAPRRNRHIEGCPRPGCYVYTCACHCHEAFR